MGKLTQYLDYLNRPSEDISADFIKYAVKPTDL